MQFQTKRAAWEKQQQRYPSAWRWPGKRVLLIDADSQADATKYLGVENPDELQNTLSTAMHCIINDLPYKTGEYIQSHPEGLDFVPSSIDLSSVEVELVNAMSRELSG